jgi:DMSO/TMAO reductase YedYZ molybdopterin-dependent catalytic subunit
MQSVTANLVSPDTIRSQRIPPGQHEVKDWPVLHYGSVQKMDPAKWSFTISGLVDKELKLNLEEFNTLPQVEVFCDIHCVTTWSRLNNTYQGPSTRTLAELARIKPEARFVVVHGAGGFSTNLPVTDFLAEDALFAFYHEGKPLSAEHGGPVRLIVPRLYFWKSAKWVTGVEFTEEDHPGFWERAGYHNHGDPWKEERYSEPGFKK